MGAVDTSGPIHIVRCSELAGRRLEVEAVTAYGRTLRCVVEYWQTSAADLDYELRATWALQIEADTVRDGALASWLADYGGIDALDNSNTGAGTG